MDLDTRQPLFLIQIEGRNLSRDITQEITSFAFTDHEEELDVLELTVTNRNLQFVDDPLFQEGNEIVARFGYLSACGHAQAGVGNLSPRKKAVIKDIDYDFPESGAPSIRLKAYDQGFRLAGKENRKVWTQPAPGILYSEIAEAIAKKNGLVPVVRETRGRHLRVVQANLSDAAFLQELAEKARGRDGDGVTGYAFYIEDDELHFHPRPLEEPPALVLEYFTDRRGVLRSFRPATKAQGAKGAGVETEAVGVDPRKKKPVRHQAGNATTPERSALGERTYLVDGNTGEGKYVEQETGHVEASYDRSEGFVEEPTREPARDVAEGTFQEAELRQVEATARTLGIPGLRAKRNIEIRGVGRKFAGVYYCQSVRHVIDGSGYACELRLKRNALGKGAGEKSEKSAGRENDGEGPREPKEEPVRMITVDAGTGRIQEG